MRAIPAVVGLLACSSLVLAATKPPASKPTKDTTNPHAACQANLKQIGVLLQMAANTSSGGTLPADLQALVETSQVDVDPNLFLSPDAGVKPPADWAKLEKKAQGDWLAKHATYTYEGGGVKVVPTGDDKIIVMSDKSKTHTDGVDLLFADGHVAFAPRATIAGLRKASDAAKRGTPAK